MMRKMLIVIVILAAAAGLPALSPPKAAQAVPALDYIVVLKDGRDPVAAAAKYGVKPSAIYTAALSGYAGPLSASQLKKVTADADTSYVNADKTWSIPDKPTATTTPPQPAQFISSAIKRIGGLLSPTAKIDGIDERVNVDIAILDSGIDPTHPDLNVVGGVDCSAGQGYADVDGHGTMVAGFAAAIDNAIGHVGVAPGARLWAVRVLNNNGKGRDPDVICGVDWVTATRTDADPTNDILVANMSLLGPGSDDGHCGTTKKQDPLHQAICASTAAGVTYVVAAGNSSIDFQTQSPAAYDEVLTATAIADYDGKPGGLATPYCGLGYPDDTPAGFSNFATLPADAAHTVAAPGVCVGSTYGDSKIDNALLGASGTSFAAPMIAGTVALCIYFGPCAGLTPPQIVQKIVSDAAAYNQANPGYGFTGDPQHGPDPNKYYGYLIHAGSY